MHKLMSYLHHKSVGLLILRVFVGFIFLVHGVQKFQNLDAMAGFFTRIGLDSFWLYLVATVETLGGVLLIAGFFTRYVGILLSVVMICAMVLFKWKIAGPTWLGRFAATEIDLALLGANLTLVFTGPGTFSLWRWYKRKYHGTCEDCKVCDTSDCERQA